MLPLAPLAPLEVRGREGTEKVGDCLLELGQLPLAIRRILIGRPPYGPNGP